MTEPLNSNSQEICYKLSGVKSTCDLHNDLNSRLKRSTCWSRQWNLKLLSQNPPTFTKGRVTLQATRCKRSYYFIGIIGRRVGFYTLFSKRCSQGICQCLNVAIVIHSFVVRCSVFLFWPAFWWASSLDKMHLVLFSAAESRICCPTSHFRSSERKSFWNSQTNVHSCK